MSAPPPPNNNSPNPQNYGGGGQPPQQQQQQQDLNMYLMRAAMQGGEDEQQAAAVMQQQQQQQQQAMMAAYGDLSGSGQTRNALLSQMLAGGRGNSLGGTSNGGDPNSNSGAMDPNVAAMAAAGYSYGGGADGQGLGMAAGLGGYAGYGGAQPGMFAGGMMGAAAPGGGGDPNAAGGQSQASLMDGINQNSLILQQLLQQQQQQNFQGFGGSYGGGMNSFGQQYPGAAGLGGLTGMGLYDKDNLASLYGGNRAGFMGGALPRNMHPEAMAALRPGPVKYKSAPRKKNKNRPRRPLSAYNIFFKEERQRILKEIPGDGDANKKQKGEDGEPVKKEEGEEEEVKTEEKEEGDDADDKDDDKSASKDDESSADVKKKRKKNPHGKIGFENLARMVGKRWKELDEEAMAYYKAKADEDMKRYKDEMEKFVTKQRNEESGGGDAVKQENKDDTAKTEANEGTEHAETSV